MVSWKSILIVGMSTSLIQGCAFRAASTGMALDQNQFAADATNQQTLFNILRARDRLPTHFTSLGQINGTIEASVNAKLGLPHADRGGQTLTTTGVQSNFPVDTKAVTSVLPKLDVAFEVSPTVRTNSNYQLAVNATETFYRGILAPIKPSTVETFINSGYSRGLLTHLFIGDVRFSIEVHASDQKDDKVIARCAVSLAARGGITDPAEKKQLESLCKDGATARFQELRNQGDILTRPVGDGLPQVEGLALDALFRCRQLAQGRSRTKRSILPIARLDELQGVAADVLKNVQAVPAKAAVSPAATRANATPIALPYTYELVETSAPPTLDYADPPVDDAESVDRACVFARRYLVSSFDEFQKRLDVNQPVSSAVSDLAFAKAETASVFRTVLLKLVPTPLKASVVDNRLPPVTSWFKKFKDLDKQTGDKCVSAAYLGPAPTKPAQGSGDKTDAGISPSAKPAALNKKQNTTFRPDAGGPGTALVLPEFFETLVIGDSIDGVSIDLVIDVSFRSSEAIIHYLGEYARDGKKLCLAGDDDRNDPMPLFALLDEATDLPDRNDLLLWMRYRGKGYGVGLYNSKAKDEDLGTSASFSRATNEVLRARTSTSLSIVQQLLNLNRNAQDLPTVQNVRITN